MIRPVDNNYLFYFQPKPTPPGEVPNNVQQESVGEKPSISGPVPLKKNESIGPKECKT
jgi:hypothetical protein